MTPKCIISFRIPPTTTTGEPSLRTVAPFFRRTFTFRTLFSSVFSGRSDRTPVTAFILLPAQTSRISCLLTTPTITVLFCVSWTEALPFIDNTPSVSRIEFSMSSRVYKRKFPRSARLATVILVVPLVVFMCLSGPSSARMVSLYA